MTTNFEFIWPYTDSIPGSFTHLNAEKLYEYAMHAKLIVEVGVDQGRSASVLAAAAEQTGAMIYLFDSWESILIDNYVKVQDRYQSPNIAIYRLSSVRAAETFMMPIHLLHIDANHYAPNPAQDCAAWLPKVVSGGVACFHDYIPGFQAVIDAVDEYCAGWEDLGVWDSLAIRRKP